VGQRVIPCAVTNEYVAGDGVVIGAVGSHDDVLVELDFTSAGPQWSGTTRTVTWTDALGQNPVNILLGVNLLAEGQTEVYLVPVPIQAKAVEGWCGMTVTGVLLDGDKETVRVVTERSLFRVRPSEVHLWEGEEDVPASAAEQLQAEIDEAKELFRVQWVYLYIGEDGCLYEQIYTGQPFDFRLDENGVLEVTYR